MKKIIITGAFLLAVPFATFAHGGSFADADEQTATPEEMKLEQQNHEQMQVLMKKFMVNGTLTEADADQMITLMNEQMQNGGDMMMGGGMMGGNGDSEYMMNGKEHNGGMGAFGMMGGGMMWMNLLHGLVAITSALWLVIGVLYLLGMRREDTSEIS